MVVGALFLIIRPWRSSWDWRWRDRSPGAVHELFDRHRTRAAAAISRHDRDEQRDQLGDLAESFNSMTASIEELLQQKAEKERMEQELRIARQIQMSLLPQGPLAMAGLSVTAHCEPAREVGGDYYDYLPLDERARRHHHRRRGGQGHVRGALHGGAEGADAVAQRSCTPRRASC